MSLFNYRMWYAWEYNLKSLWGRGFMNPIDKCIVTNKRVNARHKIMPLSLKELLSVFLILGVGFGASTMVLVSERLYYKLSKKVKL